LGINKPLPLALLIAKNPNGDLCKTSNFVEIAEGEKLTRRNITKYFKDLILNLTYAAIA